MVCPKCGGQNPDSADYCSLCFCRFSPEADQADYSQNAERQSSDFPEPQHLSEVPLLPPSGVTEPASASEAFTPTSPGFTPPPSEWGPHSAGMGEYAAPAPPSAIRRKRVAFRIPAMLSVLIMIACFAGGYFLMDWYLNNRTVTYTSSHSALSFKYPGSWKKSSAKELSSIAGVPNVEAFNEVILADSFGADMKYLVFATSVLTPPENWPSAKASIINQFSSGSSGLETAAAGVNITSVNVAESQVAGAESVDVRFKANRLSVEFDCRVVYVSHGANIYIMQLMARSGTAGAQEQVQKVLDSIEFKK